MRSRCCRTDGELATTMRPIFWLILAKFFAYFAFHCSALPVRVSYTPRTFRIWEPCVHDIIGQIEMSPCGSAWNVYTKLKGWAAEVSRMGWGLWGILFSTLFWKSYQLECWNVPMIYFLRFQRNIEGDYKNVSGLPWVLFFIISYFENLPLLSNKSLYTLQLVHPLMTEWWWSPSIRKYLYFRITSPNEETKIP